MSDYLYTLSNNTTSLDGMLVETASSVSFLSPLILMFVFFVVLLGGIFRQKLRTPEVDYSMWSVVASISTMLVALLMSVISGLIRLEWLVIVVTLTIFSGVWFFLDRGKSGI